MQLKRKNEGYMDNEELLPLMRRVSAAINRSDKDRQMVHQSQRGVLQKARFILKEMARKEEKILKKIDTALKCHEAVLERILQVNQNAEETLCNVLLAIRQNEYLQAWYPAQQGQPEQKVVGKYVVQKKTGT